MNCDNEKGFTLLELLVTVAIVGILAAIAVPEFNQYKKRAYNTRAVYQAKNLLSAFHVYLTDNPDAVPSNCTSGTTTGGFGDCPSIFSAFTEDEDVDCMYLSAGTSDATLGCTHRKGSIIFTYNIPSAYKRFKVLNCVGECNMTDLDNNLY